MKRKLSTCILFIICIICAIIELGLAIYSNIHKDDLHAIFFAIFCAVFITLVAITYEILKD